MNLEFLLGPDPLFWILLFVIFGCIILAGRLLQNEKGYASLVWLRGFVFIILVLLLLQPILKTRTLNSRLLHWAVYVDNSVSMRYHQNPSFGTIQSGVNDLIEYFNERGLAYKVHPFSEAIFPWQGPRSFTGDGVTTDVGKVLDHIENTQADIAGAILMTDGQPTQGMEPLQKVKGVHTPIYTVGIGEETPLVDVSVHSVDIPTVTIKGEPVTAKITIQSTGNKREKLNVSLFEGNTLLGSRYVRVGGGGARATIPFQFKPSKIGNLEYNVKVSTLSDEINIDNNRQVFTIRVLKDRYRIALLTGSPNMNTPVIKRFLRQNPRLKTDHYIQVDDQKFMPSLKSFWESKYELIILDNYPTRPISRNFQRIFGKKLLANQTALCLVAGTNQSAEIVEGIYPFFGIKKAENTKSIEQQQWEISDLNEKVWLFQVDDYMDIPPLKPGIKVVPTDPFTQVIAHFSDPTSTPLVLIRDKALLRSLFWSSADMSSLFYRTSETEHPQFLENFWNKSMAWLLRTGGEHELFFRLNKKEYQQGELAFLTGTSPYKQFEWDSQAQLSLNISLNQKKILNRNIDYNLAQRRWESQFRASLPGEYEYDINIEDRGNARSIQTGKFRVMESQIELNKVFLNTPLLESIASKTGGMFFRWEDRKKIQEKLLAKEEQELVTNSYKFNEHPFILYTLLVLLGAEWIIRRRKGLP